MTCPQDGWAGRGVGGSDDALLRARRGHRQGDRAVLRQLSRGEAAVGAGAGRARMRRAVGHDAQLAAPKRILVIVAMETPPSGNIPGKSKGLRSTLVWFSTTHFSVDQATSCQGHRHVHPLTHTRNFDNTAKRAKFMQSVFVLHCPSLISM